MIASITAVKVGGRTSPPLSPLPLGRGVTRRWRVGVRVRVATLEHLVLMYLYSNQPRHLGDLARIVTETRVDLAAVESYLSEVHPEMLPVLRERVQMARHPAPPPPRPKRRR